MNSVSQDQGVKGVAYDSDLRTGVVLFLRELATKQGIAGSITIAPCVERYKMSELLRKDSFSVLDEIRRNWKLSLGVDQAIAAKLISEAIEPKIDVNVSARERILIKGIYEAVSQGMYVDEIKHPLDGRSPGRSLRERAQVFYLMELGATAVCLYKYPISVEQSSAGCSNVSKENLTPMTRAGVRRYLINGSVQVEYGDEHTVPPVRDNWPTSRYADFDNSLLLVTHRSKCGEEEPPFVREEINLLLTAYQVALGSDFLTKTLSLMRYAQVFEIYKSLRMSLGEIDRRKICFNRGISILKDFQVGLLRIKLCEECGVQQMWIYEKKPKTTCTYCGAAKLKNVKLP